MPGKLTFPEARALSRQGYFVRREGWVNDDLTEVTHWFKVWTGGLWWRVAPDGSHVVLTTEYSKADLLAADWTTEGIGGDEEEPPGGGGGGGGSSGGGTGGGDPTPPREGGSGGGESPGEIPPSEPPWPGSRPPAPGGPGGSGGGGVSVGPGGSSGNGGGGVTPAPPPTPGDPGSSTPCPPCYIKIDGVCVKSPQPDCYPGTYGITEAFSYDCGVYFDETANIVVQAQGSGQPNGTYGVQFKVTTDGGSEQIFSGGLVFGPGAWISSRTLNGRWLSGTNVTVQVRLFGYSGPPGQCSYQPLCGGQYLDWSAGTTWKLCCEPPYNEGPIVPAYCS